MPLWRQALGFMALAIVALAAALTLSLHAFSIETFAASERAQATESVAAVERALDSTLEDIDQHAADWADWDDIVTFATDGNPEFERSNLLLATMRSTRWHFFAVWTPAVGLRAMRYADENFQGFRPLPTAWEAWLRPEGALLSGTDARAPSRSGMAVIDGQIWLITSRPVRRSDTLRAPIAARLVVARRLDAATLDRLRRITRLEISISPFDAPTRDRTDADALAGLRRGERAPLVEVSDAEIDGFTMLRDLRGRPAVRVRVALPRTARAQARDALAVMLATVGALVLLTGLLAARMLHRTVVLPLGRLTDAARDLAQHGHSRAVEGGAAEFRHLTRTFNAMADAIAAREDELRTANEALRAARDTAERALAARSAFLATMSHEIRTPMNGVLGMAALLEEDLTDETQRDRVRTLRSAGEALLTILNDVLDLSKIEAGRLHVEAIPFDLRGLCNDVTRLFAAPAQQRNLTLSLDVAPAVAHTVRGDPTRVRQVLVNLVGNALKFTARGEVRITVTPASDDRVRVAVRDTGIGIAPETLARLFAPFSQADSSFARRYGGTGLGLAISHRIAELLGGALSVTSAQGVGSEFALEIPLPAVCEAPRRTPAQSATRVKPPATRRGVVLAAEDNDVNRKLLGALLSRLGYEAVLVTDGAAVVEAARGRRFDAILMDCQMPVVDGFDATRRIRDEEGGDRHVPIVALTANAMSGDRERCLAAGMDDYLTKPIDARDLDDALSRWMSDRPSAAVA